MAAKSVDILIWKHLATLVNNESHAIFSILQELKQTNKQAKFLHNGAIFQRENYSFLTKFYAWISNC